MSKFHPKLHFRRFEVKYALNKEQAQELKKRLMPFLVSDSFSAGATGSYRVKSVYYDSPRFFYYHQTLDGADCRKKIRMRTYKTENNHADFIFAEIKRKNGVLVSKDRLRLSRDEFEIFKSAGSLADIATFDNGKQADTLNEFEFERMARSLEAKILITYAREAYHGKFDSDLRVTFDSDIKAKESDNLFCDESDMIDIQQDVIVLEIKFRRGLPSYIADIIRAYDLKRVPFSKYRLSVEGCGLIPRRQSIFTPINFKER